MTAPRQLCGYGCGKAWTPWAGTKLIGHAKCRFPPGEAEAILARYEADRRLTAERLGEELGVSEAVVLATIHAARARRRAPPTEADDARRNVEQSA